MYNNKKKNFLLIKAYFYSPFEIISGVIWFLASKHSIINDKDWVWRQSPVLDLKSMKYSNVQTVTSIQYNGDTYKRYVWTFFVYIYRYHTLHLQIYTPIWFRNLFIWEYVFLSSILFNSFNVRSIIAHILRGMVDKNSLPNEWTGTLIHIF